MTYFKRMTATIAVAAIALTGLTAAPARADKNDVLKLVLGAAAVYAIAKEVKRKKRASVARDEPPATVYDPTGLYDPNDDYAENEHWEGHPLGESQGRWGPDGSIMWDKGRVNPVFNSCAVELRDRNGSRTFYGKKCLKRQGYREKLPRQCEVKIRRENGWRTLYDGRCLRDAGYKIGAGHW